MLNFSSWVGLERRSKLRQKLECVHYISSAKGESGPKPLGDEQDAAQIHANCLPSGSTSAVPATCSEASIRKPQCVAPGLGEILSIPIYRSAGWLTVLAGTECWGDEWADSSRTVGKHRLERSTEHRVL